MDISKLHRIALDLFRTEHKAAGAEPDKDLVAFDGAAKLRRDHGRYTLEEAAVFIAIEGKAHPRKILKEIETSIATGGLNSYLPGENGIFRGDGITRAWREEVYDTDMNVWLERHQTRIGPIFPVCSERAEQRIKPKDRYGQLDETIDRAIKRAQSEVPRVIFMELMEILVSKVKIGQFTGVIDNAGGNLTKMRLQFLNENKNNEAEWLTYDAFRQRISRRKKKG